MRRKKIRVKILRFNPIRDRKPKFESFEVPLSEGLSVSNALEYINERYRAGLAYFFSCRAGICRGCLVKVNGQVKRACVEQLRDDIRLEPLPGRRIIKDLLVEMRRGKEE